MNPFEHYSPKTLPDALKLLAQMNGRALVNAGGTDLMLKMKAGVLAPEVVVNIKQLPELKGIAYDDAAGLRLGALATLRELTRSAVIRDRYPSLAQAAGVMASEQIRSFATVGGNLCNAAPSADLAPPLIALEGTAVIAGPNGERVLPLEAFFLSPGQSALEPGELLKEIQLPPPTGRTIYLKHAPRAYMDIAVVGVAVRLHLENGSCREARIVLAAVAPVPLRAREAEVVLEAETMTVGRIAQAAQIAAETCSPIDDVRSSAWYRRRMVKVLTHRSLQSLITP
ncbi:MAG: FAD binding domain-containing protein [Anaerolineae bacterium]